MSDFKKTSETESSAVAKRRSFLKKSATGAVLASLPAQSVWGACSVSGAMSGNLSRNTDRHDCVMPVLPAGRSPGFWSETYNGSNGINGAFKKVKGGNKTWKNNRRECYREHIKAVVDSASLGLTPELYTGSYNSLYSALLESNGGGDGSLEFNLAGVWLSSYFGFYGAADEGNTSKATARVNEILLYVFVKVSQKEDPSGSELNAIYNFTGSPESTYNVGACNYTSSNPGPTS